MASCACKTYLGEQSQVAVASVLLLLQLWLDQQPLHTPLPAAAAAAEEETCCLGAYQPAKANQEQGPRVLAPPLIPASRAAAAGERTHMAWSLTGQR